MIFIFNFLCKYIYNYKSIVTWVRHKYADDNNFHG